MSHLSSAQSVAAGLRCLPGLDGSSFAATQAAWRFYANGRVSLRRLSRPLLEHARAAATRDCDRYVLVPLDWCPLHYGSHAAKPDRVPLAHDKDLGYELLTALAVSDRDGSPLAPLCLELRAADGVHSTRAERLLPPRSPLDGLGPVMRQVANAGLGRTPVFVIDREADSVGHYRRWDKSGRLFVVRADDRPRAVHEGDELPLGDVADRLKRRRRGAFADVREVLFKGVPARQFVAETTVTIRRPARTHRVDRRTGKAKHRNVAGRAITLRLVVSEVRDGETGRVLARWLLLSNLPHEVPAATLALWYYWRWRIEGYHKLLKGAGQQLEAWQQESAAALARRLAVAAMAAVVVWGLARDPSPAAARMRHVLVRLSGRQMKRYGGGGGGGGHDPRGFTEPALLAGLGVLVPTLLLLEHHDLHDIRRLADTALPGLMRRDTG